VDVAPKKELYANPLHPILKLCFRHSVLTMRREGTISTGGDVPSPINPPAVAFLFRCFKKFAPARTKPPELKEVAPTTLVAALIQLKL
jgi:peptide/nickel transport system ATP-binding protein